VRRWQQWGPALGLLAAFALLAKCQSDEWSRERDALVRAADSLRVQTRADSILAAAYLARADSLADVTAEATERAQEATDRADILRAERRRLLAAAGRQGAAPADSTPVTAADSALTLAVEETIVLRAALEHNREALKASQQQVAELRGALSLETAAAAALRVELANTTDLLKRADPPCRFLLWGCPSRTVAFVGGAVVTAFTVHTFTR
jgi:hypothetical protein